MTRHKRHRIRRGPRRRGSSALLLGAGGPLLGLALAVASVASCGQSDRPKPFAGLGGAGAGGAGGLEIDGSSTDGPPPLDAPGLCGNEIIPAVVDLPNLYFIVDRSGSMSEQLPGSSYNLYVNARIAIGNVLRNIGHRVRYGAAIYPVSGGEVEGCEAGKEVFPTQVGDPASYAAAGEDGPILKAFLTTLAGYAPEGGTPTSPTLVALTPMLTALPGKTFVVLATDGAPNCNVAASCTAAECQANIEGYFYNGQECNDLFNCCDPNIVPDGQYVCVDRPASVAAVQALQDAGILTYVVGMPGSELYASVLDEMAVAGGTARPDSPKYYSVADAEELATTLKAIGVTVSISCTLELGSAPPEPNMVNVYLDSSLLKLDPVDGWAWLDDQTIELRGVACDTLMSGDVLQVQIVSGCPTVVK